MKCPKCHYLSFEPEARCRNCGYDLSVQEADLALHAADPAPGQPLADLSLRVPAPASAPVELKNAPVVMPRGPDRPVDVPLASGMNSDAAATENRRRSTTAAAVAEPPMRPSPSPVAAPPAARTTAPKRPSRPNPAPRPQPKPAPTTDLPLFMKGATSEASPAVPVPTRSPLVVQRRTAELSRTAAAPAPPRKLGPFDRDLLEDLQRIERAERERARGAAMGASGQSAGLIARLMAAGLDAALLAGISAVVTWLTLRWCGLTLDDLAMLPMVPLTAFLGLLAIGYLLLFTAAGGQTIGKMANGIRVVAGDEAADGVTLTIGQSALRATLTLPSVLAFGAGFLPGLVGEHRAFHDRVAHTRVVRA